MFIIASSNKLPFILSDKAEEDPDEKYDYGAFQSRIKFHKLTNSFRNKDSFPYSVEDLATYLLDKAMEIKGRDLGSIGILNN